MNVLSLFFVFGIQFLALKAARADPEPPALIVELNGANFTPQNTLGKLVVSQTMLTELETKHLDCAYLNRADERFMYLTISRREATVQGLAYKVDIFASSQTVSEKPPRAVQVALSAKDISVSYSRDSNTLSVKSPALLPAMDVNAIPELKIVSNGEFEGQVLGNLLCTYYTF